METTTTVIAKPSQELLALAKEKARKLPVNCQIRLTADEHSYWVMNFEGKAYIGREVDSLCTRFFKCKELHMTTADGKVTHYLQPLKLS